MCSPQRSQMILRSVGGIVRGHDGRIIYHPAIKNDSRRVNRWRDESSWSQFSLNRTNGLLQNIPFAFPCLNLRRVKLHMHRFRFFWPDAAMFCEIVCVMVNNRSTEFAPRQDVKAILRTGACTGELDENTH